MENSLLALDDFAFSRTKVDVEEIRNYGSEDQFMSLSVELLKEVSEITGVLACIYRSDQEGNPRRWTRNEAILGGLMVRIDKLQRGILDQTCQNRLEIVNILFRCLVESIINLKYLLVEKSEELFNAYIEYSFGLEKQLLDQVKQNINERGSELPIEERIKRSIESSAKVSSISLEQLGKNRKNLWREKGLKERLARIGGERAYIGLFGLPCHAVHGNWQELERYHLEYEDGSFSPKMEWSYPRPQPLFASAFLSIDVNKAYLNAAIPPCDDRDKINKTLDDLMIRVSIADELHEEFLKKKMHCEVRY